MAEDESPTAPRAPRGRPPVPDRRGGPRRDRRGRGRRGPDVLPSPLAPFGIPGQETRNQRFDALLLDVFDDIERRWEARMPPIDLAVEEVPMLPVGWSGDRVPLASLAPATSIRRARLVLFRRPIERRAREPEDLAALLLAVCVEHVAELLGLPPGDVHPDYRAED